MTLEPSKASSVKTRFPYFLSLVWGGSCRSLSVSSFWRNRGMDQSRFSWAQAAQCSSKQSCDLKLSEAAGVPDGLSPIAVSMQ